MSRFPRFSARESREKTLISSRAVQGRFTFGAGRATSCRTFRRAREAAHVSRVPVSGWPLPVRSSQLQRTRGKRQVLGGRADFRNRRVTSWTPSWAKNKPRTKFGWDERSRRTTRQPGLRRRPEFSAWLTHDFEIEPGPVFRHAPRVQHRLLGQGRAPPDRAGLRLRGWCHHGERGPPDIRGRLAHTRRAGLWGLRVACGLLDPRVKQ